MAIPKRKPQTPANNWGAYRRIWRMLALAVVIGIVVYQRYQANQPRGGVKNHRDLKTQEIEFGRGEHPIDVQVIEEEPETQDRLDGETASDAPAEKREPEITADEVPSAEAPVKKGPQKASPPIPAESRGSGPTTVIKNVQVRNQDGKLVYQGNVDVSKTLHRIEAGERLRFPNDGVVFQNRERRLPGKPAGYYHEWVHPTPQVDGPGPQRIVTGKEGEIYYTHDHYRTFKPLHRQ